MSGVKVYGKSMLLLKAIVKKSVPLHAKNKNARMSITINKQ
jgi:hypothetical protein